jgi:hypothetical protein
MMHEDAVLESYIGFFLRRLLLDTGKQKYELSKGIESWLSVLATQVQMGTTNLNVVSHLVAKGYENLTVVTRTLQHSSTCILRPAGYSLTRSSRARTQAAARKQCAS